ncbi:hypothetical protein BpHYR1_043412 [Brachionus plicatilis]|uniref:Uncharacterized protein n=1 Tax=Brachionus plicatilis TaxID=10195 RepID=A0A3M7SNR8_BRAPC|nr:hypothetical protein BpHYR1_043412 [Brachionus plicatilis]
MLQDSNFSKIQTVFEFNFKNKTIAYDAAIQSAILSGYQSEAVQNTTLPTKQTIITKMYQGGTSNG